MRTGEIIVDSFAGGGGASLGISWATGRAPDIAINHDLEAIALHKANHPESEHHSEDVWHVDPVNACRGRPVGLMWLSPDCKHFSKAKGGKPVSKKIRGLAWIAVRWAKAVRPRVIVLENVEEFQSWGPVLSDGQPCPKRRGQTYRAFRRSLERLGYVVDARELRACDYGAPTIRKRLFLIARCDGQPIVWPAPTHGKYGVQPWRTAAECIEWSLPCPSIFERKKPLAEKTQRRIARGVQRFVIDNPRPFIVPTAHAGDERSHSLGEPLRTITGSRRGDHALVAPVLTQRYGEWPNHPPRGTPIDRPMPTVTPTQNGTQLVQAFLAKHYGDRGQRPGSGMDEPVSTVTAYDHNALVTAHLQRDFGKSVGSRASEPVPTITGGGGGHAALVTSNLLHLRGTEESHLHGDAVDAPLRTLSAHGLHAAEVRAFLFTYYGTKQRTGDLLDPSPTITGKDRMGLVTVHGVEYVIADIGMRMLQPRELYRAQGFPDSYRIDIPYNGKPLTKTAQVRMVGNSVCPPLAAAIVRANYVEAADQERVA